MPSIISEKTVYAFFRLGLVTGLVPKSAVTRWADRQILGGEVPSEEMIELSLSARLPYSQIIYMLNLYQGSPDADLPVRLLLAHTGQLLERNAIPAERLIQELSLLNAEEYLAREWRAKIHELEVCLERYRLGVSPLAELIQCLEIFLGAYRIYVPQVEEILSEGT